LRREPQRDKEQKEFELSGNTFRIGLTFSFPDQEIVVAAAPLFGIRAADFGAILINRATACVHIEETAGSIEYRIALVPQVHFPILGLAEALDCSFYCDSIAVGYTAYIGARYSDLRI
jgi:hypothetical protein